MDTILALSTTAIASITFILVVYLVLIFKRHASKEHAKGEHDHSTMGSLAALCPRPMFNVSKKGIIQYANLGSNDLLRQWERQIGERVPQQILDAITLSDEDKLSNILGES